MYHHIVFMFVLWYYYIINKFKSSVIMIIGSDHKKPEIKFDLLTLTEHGNLVGEVGKGWFGLT